MREAQLGELGNFILETTGINDFYRYFNGVDPITGEKLTNNQRSLSGLLGLLGAVSTAEGIKMLTNLQKGYAMMQGVDIADDIARASTVSDDILVDSYKNLRTNKDIPGQAHHLNQDAAFRDYIPKNDGLAVKLEGNIFTDIGSPHYNAHESLEGFWNNYRKNGDLLGLKPSLSDYNAALKQSLLNAGLSEAQADAAVLKAAAQQANAGLFSDDFIPRIPGRINLPKPKP
nr:pre-toxin TG domain-containing protein [Enterococcus sp. BWR-S5]